ncbi:VOC family protein [Sulfitobacter geojensis]|jgi:predicted enzyme related to lactoylglutathione lyase|uniref:VOC family protein n=1 Tax=Sulfitobacter geojensis TaxID=1342299 RepID=UPI00046AC233|nr:VOC family protein [Sulfitobacter geojensis]KHA51710.1 Glyoxalase/bleomycin resistance protein/dioxygenase [Sulfitobacter geojensis]NYI29124.1 putative enzyme related to lactoylglutathione lyase [Sulfitobacter geojensis]OAN95580.1 glyoxalase [Sulfitobacter geojensis]
MTVKRIVANIATSSVQELQSFYTDVFDLDVVMDMGWIATLASGENAPVQISFASEGGSGTPVPDMSIEVDDVDAVYARAQKAGHAIFYPLTDEPWGVRRFYLYDPAGKLLNVLAHNA